jgi:hypothetical protein
MWKGKTTKEIIQRKNLLLVRVYTQRRDKPLKSILFWKPGVVVHVPVIQALRRLRQEHCEFKASLGYIARSCLKKKKKTKSTFFCCEE